MGRVHGLALGGVDGAGVAQRKVLGDVGSGEHHPLTQPQPAATADTAGEDGTSRPGPRRVAPAAPRRAGACGRPDVQDTSRQLGFPTAGWGLDQHDLDAIEASTDPPTARHDRDVQSEEELARPLRGRPERNLVDPLDRARNAVAELPHPTRTGGRGGCGGGRWRCRRPAPVRRCTAPLTEGCVMIRRQAQTGTKSPVGPRGIEPRTRGLKENSNCPTTAATSDNSYG
jgi:hypothetical protein